MTHPNSLKTHCPKGHPYDEHNTILYVRKSTGRLCRKCAACRRERENSPEYKAKAKRSKRHNEIVKAWEARNPEKAKAYMKVLTAIRSGKLVKPDSCSKCGKTNCRIEASHDDYTKPLEVEWLCVRCHRAKDRKYKLPEEVNA